MTDLCKAHGLDFFNKANENFRASRSLYDEKLYNAASNRIYFCLIHTALSRALSNEVSRDCYLRKNEKIREKKPDIEYTIDKSKIENNIRGIGVKDPRKFSVLLSTAKSARAKADYFPEKVTMQELDKQLIDLENILKSEGVLSD